MGWIIGGIIAAMLLIFLSVIIIRTLRFLPYKEREQEVNPIEIDREKIVADMVDMIRCKTVSDRDESRIDRNEFVKFQALLQERFPKIHEKCQLHKIGKTGLLYFLPGQSDTKPTVCMAHYDVVPVEEEGWDKPAFEGVIEDGFIWGRGTLDTKGTLCGLMEALEKLLQEEYIIQCRMNG